MATDFLRILLGRKPTMPAEVAEAQAELERLGKERPILAELAEQLHGVLLALYAAPVRVAEPAISKEIASEKLNGGVPLLRGETLDVSWGEAQRRMWAVAAALADRRPDAARALGQAIRSRKLAISELAASVLAGQPHEIHETAGSLGLDVGLVGSVVALALFPVLVPIQVGLEPLLSAGSWTEGYCPVCGSFPKLGEFRGLEQIRFLRCGLCAAQWQFPRLRCAGCGQRDHRQLGYLHVAGEENKWRAATCDECRQYIKMVATLTPLSPLQLLVTDVATIHVDLLAADKGFSPPM
jgi:FdhE protein